MGVIFKLAMATTVKMVAGQPMTIHLRFTRTREYSPMAESCGGRLAYSRGDRPASKGAVGCNSRMGRAIRLYQWSGIHAYLLNNLSRRFSGPEPEPAGAVGREEVPGPTDGWLVAPATSFAVEQAWSGSPRSF